MKTAVNEITGDALKTGVTTDKFREGHELIWGKAKSSSRELQGQELAIETSNKDCDEKPTPI